VLPSSYFCQKNVFVATLVISWVFRIIELYCTFSLHTNEEMAKEKGRLYLSSYSSTQIKGGREIMKHNSEDRHSSP